ncbi:MAG: hypothetical protein CMH49_07165 [Myxococcales bacterium]|nr:hypothetical protein [Myxococcales bacterium]
MKVQVSWSKMLKTMLSISHLFFFGVSLLVIACEWKPPRRPIKTSLLSQADSENLKDTTIKSSPEDNAQSGSKSEPKPQLIIEPMSDSKSNQTESVSTRPNPQESEVISQEDQLLQRDYLLTIDPDGPPLIHLKEFTIALSVVNRMPKDAQRLINRSQKQVISYLRVRNFEKLQKIQIKWIHNKEIIQLDRLQVGISPRWRTWSSLRFNKTKKRLGEWRVEVSTSAGKLIGLTHFVRQ